MSSCGTVTWDLTIIDREYDEAASEWAMGFGYKYRDKDGNLVIQLSSDYADTLENEVRAIGGELSELPIPLDAWECWIYYESAEYPFEDGGITELTIRNGRIASVKESRIEMVDAEPWFKFDLKEEACWSANRTTPTPTGGSTTAPSTP